MQRILITSGPTREYLDPVRFLTNSSTGKMGSALAEAALQQGYLPVIVSGPVAVSYPSRAEVHWIETTCQMLKRCEELFPGCCGVIGAAAPCDFMPSQFSEQKLSKESFRGQSTVLLQFAETPDILAALGKMKRTDQWSIGFALETENGEANALRKLQRKNCNLIVLNTPDSIGSETAAFQVFDSTGRQRLAMSGSKQKIAKELFQIDKFKPD
jgi:phosphopantothenoylcysteine decarboxylase/phosphopantothenate--cysteine ligase